MTEKRKQSVIDNILYANEIYASLSLLAKNDLLFGLTVDLILAHPKQSMLLSKTIVSLCKNNSNKWLINQDELDLLQANPQHALNVITTYRSLLIEIKINARELRSIHQIFILKQTLMSPAIAAKCNIAAKIFSLLICCKDEENNLFNEYNVKKIIDNCLYLELIYKNIQKLTENNELNSKKLHNMLIHLERTDATTTQINSWKIYSDLRWNEEIAIVKRFPLQALLGMFPGYKIISRSKENKVLLHRKKLINAENLRLALSLVNRLKPNIKMPTIMKFDEYNLSMMEISSESLCLISLYQTEINTIVEAIDKYHCSSVLLANPDQAMDIISDLEKLFYQDKNHPIFTIIDPVTEYGKSALECLRQMYSSGWITSSLNEKNYNQIIYNIHHAPALLPAFKYLNSGIVKCLTQEIIDMIIAKPTCAMDIAKEYVAKHYSIKRNIFSFTFTPEQSKRENSEQSTRLNKYELSCPDGEAILAINEAEYLEFSMKLYQ